jgi:hypothetical protein
VHAYAINVVANCTHEVNSAFSVSLCNSRNECGDFKLKKTLKWPLLTCLFAKIIFTGRFNIAAKPRTKKTLLIKTFARSSFTKKKKILASKRPRINVEDCSLEGSDSDAEELKKSRQSSPVNVPAPSAPTPSPEPTTSPDPDLDVEEDTQSEAPENLSLKKPSSPETPPQPTHNFIPYQQFPAFPHFQPQYTTQRSPVDVLMRVFPGKRRSDVEALLQRWVSPQFVNTN